MYIHRGLTVYDRLFVLLIGVGDLLELRAASESSDKRCFRPCVMMVVVSNDDNYDYKFDDHKVNQRSRNEEAEIESKE